VIEVDPLEEMMIIVEVVVEEKRLNCTLVTWITVRSLMKAPLPLHKTYDSASMSTTKLKFCDTY